MAQSEHQISPGPHSGAKCSQLNFYKKGTSELSTIKNFSPAKLWALNNTELILSAVPSRNIRVRQNGGDPVPGPQRISAGWRTASSITERCAIASART